MPLLSVTMSHFNCFLPPTQSELAEPDISDIGVSFSKLHISTWIYQVNIYLDQNFLYYFSWISAMRCYDGLHLHVSSRCVSFHRHAKPDHFAS